MTRAGQISTSRAWVIAARPQTLPAAASPVIVGTGLAINAGVFAPLPAVAALLGAVLIQVGTNFANDYFDAQKGADTPTREGFTRVTASGLIPPHQVKQAMVLTFTLAMIVGVYLVVIGGIPILLVGLASIAAGILYTGGPYPFGYYGLGDLFVFIFFGLIAVTGTYYVQAVAQTPLFPFFPPAGTITVDALIASLPMAGLITNILVVNNIRDLETDRAAGKHTLAVKLGYTGSRLEFLTLLLLAYLVPFWFLTQGYHPAVLLPILSLPYAIRITRTILTQTSGSTLNRTLEQTGRLTAAYALLFSIGLAI